HLVDEDVTHFMEHRKERIAHDEFQPIEALLFGEILETRIALECTGKLLDALVKRLRRSRWRLLPQERSAAGQQQAYRGTGTPILLTCHCKTPLVISFVGSSNRKVQVRDSIPAWATVQAGPFQILHLPLPALRRAA